MTTVRIEIPVHLRRLAGVDGEVRLTVDDPPTIEAALNALEAVYPMLRGTMREHGTRQRRAYIRYFACGRDLSFEPPAAPLPHPVVEGVEPFCILGAISGG